MTKKSDSKWLSLATAPILGQPPRFQGKILDFLRLTKITVERVHYYILVSVDFRFRTPVKPSPGDQFSAPNPDPIQHKCKIFCLT